MSEPFGFAPQRRGVHRLAGRTILQIVPALDAGEGNRHAIDVAAGLADIGARALVACAGGPLVSELQAKGGVWVPLRTGSTNPVALALGVRGLRRILHGERVALVHPRSRATAWLAWGATSATGTPLVTGVHQVAAHPGALRQRYDSIMARGDMVVAGSCFAAAQAPALYPAAAGRVSLIRPGVDLHDYDPRRIDPARVQALRHAWRIAPDERIVLLCGRPSLWKGHGVLVAAARHLAERGIRDIKVVMVGAATGRGGPAREIEAAVARAGMAEAVRCVAACADMPAALLAAAVLVVPSLEPEAFGRVVVEAQALGTPAVVSDLGAVPEAVLAPPDVEPARRTGWRVPVNDPALLADAIAEALSLGASSRDALAQRARQQAEERFSVERMVRQTLEAYAALLDSRDEAGPPA